MKISQTTREIWNVCVSVWSFNNDNYKQTLRITDTHIHTQWNNRSNWWNTNTMVMMNSGFVFAFKLKKSQKKKNCTLIIRFYAFWFEWNQRFFFRTKKKPLVKHLKKKMGAKAKRKNRITIFQSCSYTHTHWIDENNEKKMKKNWIQSNWTHTKKNFSSTSNEKKNEFKIFNVMAIWIWLSFNHWWWLSGFFSFWFDHQIT